MPTNRDGQAGGDDGDRGYGRDATPGGGRPVPARRPVYSDVDLREQETGNTIYSSNTEPLSARPPRKKSTLSTHSSIHYTHTHHIPSPHSRDTRALSCCLHVRTHPTERNRKPRKQDDDSYLDRANEDEHSSSSTQPSHSQDEREDDPNYDNARDKKTRREQQPPERRRRAPSSGSSSSSSARARGVSLDSRRQTGGATAAAAAASVVGGSVGASTESGRCGYPMAWNAEFQKILELPQDDEQQQVRSASISLSLSPQRLGGPRPHTLASLYLRFLRWCRSSRNSRDSVRWRPTSSIRPKRAARSSSARRTCPTNSRPSVRDSNFFNLHCYLLFYYWCLLFVCACEV